MAEKSAHQEFGQRVDALLWEKWDPIGINASMDARGEYRSYAARICAMLREGSRKQEILDYLYWAESVHMGLSCSQEQAEAKNSAIADEILQEFAKIAP